MQAPEPQMEHQWLKQLMGDWTYEHECVMGPDQPPMKCAGTAKTTALGELWILLEMTGPAPDGSETRSLIQLGYDPKQTKFVGSFIASVMTRLWPYAGTLDESKKVLTLDSEGPSFTDENTLIPYQDIIEVVDDKQFILRSRMQTPDGQWVDFMQGTFQRASSSAAANCDPEPTVTPHLICADGIAAIDFYKRAFNATEELRLLGPGGKLMHGCVRIGCGAVMLAEENPDWGCVGPKALKGTPVTLHLKVPDVDAAIAQAVAAGAVVAMPAADMFWGDRYGQVIDPFGHKWSLATTKQKLTPAEMQAAMERAFSFGGK